MDSCVTREDHFLNFVSVSILSRGSSFVKKAPTGTHLPSPPLSPEGLHQIEVGKLVQIHEGMEHCQVQLFPGRTGAESRTGRRPGGLRHLVCTVAASGAGCGAVLAWPRHRPDTGGGGPEY